MMSTSRVSAQSPSPESADVVSIDSDGSLSSGEIVIDLPSPPHVSCQPVGHEDTESVVTTSAVPPPLGYVPPHLLASHYRLLQNLVEPYLFPPSPSNLCEPTDHVARNASSRPSCENLFRFDTQGVSDATHPHLMGKQSHSRKPETSKRPRSNALSDVFATQKPTGDTKKMRSSDVEDGEFVDDVTEVVQGDKVSDSEIEEISNISAVEWSKTERPCSPADPCSQLTPVTREQIQAPFTVAEVAQAVASLSPEEVHRQAHWALWMLQERLGSAYPSCLKRISEPPLKLRPLQTLRYIEDPTLSIPTEVWSSAESIRDEHGTVMVDATTLRTVRDTLCFPGTSPPASPLCKLCGSPDCICVVSGGTRCIGTRCARCCRVGHMAAHCYQQDIFAWENRFLHFLDNAYQRSIETCMLRNTHKNRSFPQICLTCAQPGHLVCQLPPALRSTPSLHNTQKLVEDLFHYSSRRHLDIRWDRDASPSQDMEWLEPPRYKASKGAGKRHDHSPDRNHWGDRSRTGRNSRIPPQTTPSSSMCWDPSLQEPGSTSRIRPQRRHHNYAPW